MTSICKKHPIFSSCSFLLHRFIDFVKNCRSSLEEDVRLGELLPDIEPTHLECRVRMLPHHLFLKTVGLAHPSLDGVPVHGALEAPFGDHNSQLSRDSRIGDVAIEAFQGIRRAGKPPFHNGPDGQRRLDAFFLREGSATFCAWRFP